MTTEQMDWVDDMYNTHVVEIYTYQTRWFKQLRYAAEIRNGFNDVILDIAGFKSYAEAVEVTQSVLEQMEHGSCIVLPTRYSVHQFARRPRVR